MSAPLVTLDSRYSRDIDDAFRVTRLEDGYAIEVAIANAAFHVPLDSDEDLFAREAAASVYWGRRVHKRMLPPHISENKGSLVEGTLRQAVVYRIELSDQLSVRGFSVEQQQVRIDHRLSYETLSDVLENPEHPANTMVKLAADLAFLLLAKRRDAGALAFFDMRRLLVSSEEGKPLKFETAEEAVGHVLVQELMILVNSEGAKFLLERNVPTVFRNHEAKLASPSASDVAMTVQALLSSGSGDSNQIEKTINLMASSAEYGETARGHYGLTLPVYAHLTSPLRRYADLVNQRQLIAHLAGAELPFNQEQVAEIARDINTTLNRRKTERSEDFKAALAEKVGRALDGERFSHLAEHELIKALELGVDVGGMPDALALEVVRRFSRQSASDRVAYAVFALGLQVQLPESVKNVCVQWLEATPGKALSFLTHASNLGLLRDVHVNSRTERSQPPIFSAYARATSTQPGVGRVDGAATQGTKRGAEQVAVLRLVATLMGLALSTPDDISIPVSPSKPNSVRHAPQKTTAAEANAKSRLGELCQKMQWPLPVYQSTAEGASHCPSFTCLVSVTTATETITATASSGTTKKQAEMLAAAEMLIRLENAAGIVANDAVSVPTLETSVAAAGNPVGALNEWTQRRKLPDPVYSFWSKTPGLPPFVCNVVVTGLGELGARGGTKQAAKRAAAEAVLQRIVERGLAS
ncbi:hypothetical protein WL29_21710 [Burkholderia ubonensis]|uniref:DRBM domain-containing protein n=1 Tax=Burkholderia ubonensis TaxID=101571 RepID=A0A125DMD1_9BURK|nr:RNB domain-containing ribonuclease [Burkholderia ubonensis]KWA83985.1 hypothetical protein WL29_21710 [Burkholderia ubonensis]